MKRRTDQRRTCLPVGRPPIQGTNQVSYGSKRQCVKREAHRPHTEALGSSFKGLTLSNSGPLFLGSRGFFFRQGADRIRAPARKARGQPPSGRGTLLQLDRLGFFPMLRPCSCVVALAMMLVGLSTAQAADTTLTLTCQGTEISKMGATDKGTQLELTPFGLIVNLTARTVEGFPVSNPFPVKVTAANQAGIEFEGSETLARGFIRRLSGTIDRVTGEASATFTMGDGIATFSLKCRPAQRMF
jgi:hypothetical protein